MKFYSIKNKLSPLSVFSLQDLFLIDPTFRQATLYDWEKAGNVVKLRNNCYIFNDFKPKDLDFYALSNQIYKPSYVSMELALNHYNIIPEGVQIITALSTNKTKTFTTSVGIFRYQSIRPELFFGYDLLEHKNRGVQLACLEKAILDYLYLHPEIATTADFESLRWNREELTVQLNSSKMKKYLTIYDNNSLEERVSHLRTYLKG